MNLKQKGMTHTPFPSRSNRGRDEVFKRSREKLNKVLRDYGIHTPDDLERQVRKNVTNNEDIKNYEQLKDRYKPIVIPRAPNANPDSIDKYDTAEGLILDIVSLIGVITGVIIVVIGVAGIISGGAAWAALGVVGAIGALVGALMLVVGAIEGAQERAVGQCDLD